MDMQSPFEVWRLKYLDGIGMSSELLKIIAQAFEGGQIFEREACAKVCDEKVNAEYATGKVDHNEMGWTQACAIAIRARGQ